MSTLASLYLPGVPLPDNKLWTHRYRVQSRTKPAKSYVLAMNKRSGNWGCSCAGYRFNGKCKHLDEYDLPTHKGGKA